MNECDDLIDDLDRQCRDQIELALVADEPPVVAMHIDLAIFTGEQARFAEDICDED